MTAKSTQSSPILVLLILQAQIFLSQGSVLLRICMQTCLLNLIVSIKKQISVRLSSYCTILGTYIDSLLVEGSVGTRKHRLIEVGNRAIVANLTTWAILFLFLISIGCFAMERPVGGVRVTILIINEWSWCRARI